jgi:glucokinase
VARKSSRSGTKPGRQEHSRRQASTSAEAIVGVDLGGTSVRAGKVEDGKVVGHAQRRISGNAAEEVVLAEIFAAVDEVIDDEVAGIGCGVPSVVDVERGIVYTVEHIPSWREVHLKDAFEARYGIPTTINNDANAFALGELHFGAGRGFRHLVGITLGTGVGSGVIVDGRLYSGANCGAGEIGSIPYRDATIETYCASHFFNRRAGVGGDVVFERARQGDAEAVRLFHEFGRELGQAVLTVLYCFDPELIVFGGSIARAFPLFEPGLREALAGFAYRHALERLTIACSEIEDAAILGAAALHIDAQARRLQACDTTGAPR